ncbi:MAG: long-chain fatty acid--CoA ligase [Alicyclobacillaceae bacterium]|nr:long-chain fatty acid--CoA ligase [Alicyclobacillaceae bacterium]
MMTRHYPFWPARVPKTLTVPATSLYDNLAVSARRYPDKTAVVYYGRLLSYRELLEQVDRLAGFLQRNLKVEKGDRVILYLQNSPQFIIGYYAVLRAGGVVVPLNPMHVTEELAFYIQDCDARVALVGQELFPRIAPLIGATPLKDVIVAAYSDYLPDLCEWEIPDVVEAPREPLSRPGVVLWKDALDAGEAPVPVEVSTSEDLAVLPYTSGTTGKPKGCMHTHRTTQANIVSAVVWSRLTSEAVALATLPLFHVTGMQHSMNAPIYGGSTIVLMTRWNRDLAARLIERYGCTHWTNISTMVVDFLSNPDLSKYDIRSLVSIGGGGAALPEAVGEKLFQTTGVRYAEGYGLSETMSQTHMNPPDRPKLQCMGIPAFDVDARIIDPDTGRELGPGEEGEVIVSGPQVFLGYWNRPEETEKAFLTIDGKLFFRTGDIARYDEEGYFFMVDRVKRMINAAGFKVWPSEVEAILYRHPAIKEACVIGRPDPRRGETVKAFVVLQDEYRGKVSEQDIIEWSKGQMAAYKYPRIVEFVDRLPVSGSGKILWRQLQEEERARVAQGQE